MFIFDSPREVGLHEWDADECENANCCSHITSAQQKLGLILATTVLSVNPQL